MNFSFRRTSFLLLAATALLAVSCGGGGGGGADAEKTAGKLGLIDISVADFDGVALNEIILFEFTEELQSDSVRPDTIQVREGPLFGRQVFGSFRIDGNQVWFYPDLPSKPDAPVNPGEVLYQGYRPGTTYRITLPGAPKVAVVRNYVDDPLRKTYQETFQTALATDAGVYVDNFLDPLPARVRFSNPPDGAVEVPAASEIRLEFNRRPLNPATVTTATVRMTMIERNGLPTNRPVPGEPLLRQSFDRVSIIFDPRFELADNATYRLVAERLEDLVGNDVEYYECTFSVRVEPPRDGSRTIEFDDTDIALRDDDVTTATWGEVVDGALAATFTLIGGTGILGDLDPTGPQQFDPGMPGVYQEVEARPGGGTVTYDVYSFRQINIPSGVTVTFERGTPNRPIKILSLFPIQIDGGISLRGGDGQNGETASNTLAMPPAAGGTSGPGGGNGADAYTTTVRTYARRDHGERSPLDQNTNARGNGGEGGASSSYSYASHGGGGGGGGNRLAGTNGIRPGYTGYSAYNGALGVGGPATVLNPASAYIDLVPTAGGGGGGGAGGMGWYSSGSYLTTAGGGGGGGGAVTIQTSASITIGSSGRIDADGGDGGDVSRYYYCYGGGGGGGAGGAIRLATTSTLTVADGATLTVSGGTGGPWSYSSTTYRGGMGGNGGNGWLCLASQDLANISLSPGANVTYAPYRDGTFYPTGSGDASIGQTEWIDLGVFDPQLQEHDPGDPHNDREAELYGYGDATMEIEIQMAIDNTLEPGTADLSVVDLLDQDGDGFTDDPYAPTGDPTDVMSEWTRIEQMHTLNGKGYQHFRIRVTFNLPVTHNVDAALPYLKFLKIRYTY